ncbi:Bro-N domain-containing protein [Patescibacteria group bacterium]|nr:Bro-N domain-containing protein [Patescibacteria group bacterium]
MNKIKNTKFKKVAIFEGKKIRRIWDEKKEKWYFSVVDIIQVLIQQVDYQSSRKYWNKLKERLKKEGNESVSNCHQLKLEAADGKLYLTDTADVETVLRLIQSVPSPKAEPVKLWLAKVGYERIEEINDPERALNRSRDYWQKMGRSQKWIQQRMMGQEIRNKLTDYWKNNEVKEQDEYAILTNIIHEEWSDLSVKKHKSLKNLKTENLRDHMSDAEIVFTALAELSTRQIAETMETRGLEENKIPAKKGGRIAKNARLELEQKTGQKIVTGANFRLRKQVVKFPPLKKGD